MKACGVTKIIAGVSYSIVWGVVSYVGVFSCVVYGMLSLPNRSEMRSGCVLRNRSVADCTDPPAFPWQYSRETVMIESHFITRHHRNAHETTQTSNYR